MSCSVRIYHDRVVKLSASQEQVYEIRLFMRTELQQISSRDNERLKHARRVRDGKVEGRIFLEGVRLVADAVGSGTAIETVFVSAAVRPRLEDLVSGTGAKFAYEVSDSVLQSLGDTKTSQGIIAIAERPVASPEDIAQRLETAAVPIVVFLERVNNPSNVGAVIRSAEAAGVAGVIVSKGSADTFSPKALRAAMGSSLRLAVWSGADLGNAMLWAKDRGMRTTAADVEATLDYSAIDWRRPRLLIIGSEASGLSDDDRRSVDELTFIPMESEVESLNLAVATGIILFEARRQVCGT
jgi:TrmH family RNA methyltransferase